MNVLKALVVSVCVMPMVITAGDAFAGFNFTTTGQQVDPSAVSTPSPLSPVSPLQSRAPALQIFQDKYVPDVIKKKYHLQDDWYGESAPLPAPAPAPVLPPVPEESLTDIPVPVTATPVPATEVPQSIVPEPAVVVDTWRARKGEPLRDILQRWSTRSETDLMWASTDNPVLQKDFSFLGKYQDAVNALIKEAGGSSIHSQYRSEGMTPVMSAPASTVTTNSPPPLPQNIAVVPKPTSIFSKVFQPEEKPDRAPETRWFGLSGAPLNEVIRVWADDAGVDLVWMSEKDFALKNSISQVGTFEDAIYQALSQYDNDTIRPVGEMYNDPQTGHKVLVVRTDILPDTAKP